MTVGAENSCIDHRLQIAHGWVNDLAPCGCKLGLPGRAPATSCLYCRGKPQQHHAMLIIQCRGQPQQHINNVFEIQHKRHETTTTIRSTLTLHSNLAQKFKNSTAEGAKNKGTKNPGDPGTRSGREPEGRLSTLWRPSLQNSTLDLDFSSWACPAASPSTAYHYSKRPSSSATCF